MTDLVSVLVDGFIYSSYLFIISVGLTLIYGVMKILNMAHGSLYALGAYVTATFVGFWFGHNLNPYVSFLLLPLAAVVVGLVAGPLIERGLLRIGDEHDPVEPFQHELARRIVEELAGDGG